MISSEAREIADKIEPGKQALVIPIDENSVVITVEPESWVNSAYGIAEGAWGEVEATEYVRMLRDADENREA